MKHITNYKPKDFAELLNVSVKTLQRWDRDGTLIAKRTPTDRRYYTYDQYLEYNGELLVTFKCSTQEAYNKLIETSVMIGGIEIAENIQSRIKTNETTDAEN